MILTIALIFSTFFSDLKGRVVDENGVPVPYAVIQYQETYTVANDQGEFLLIDPLRPGILTVSCLGFTTKSQSIEGSENFITVVLASKYYELEEFTVQPINELEVMARVIQQIFENKIYSTNSIQYEYGQKNLFLTSEGQFERRDYFLIDRKNNGTRRLPQFRILTGQKDTSQWSHEKLSDFYSANYFMESMEFFHELSHNPGFLDPDRFRDYSFTLLDEDSYLYRIEINSKKANLRFNGEIWINKEDLGVFYLKYAENLKSLKAENLKFAILVKPTLLKKIELKDRVFEFWTAKDDEGNYFIKTQKSSWRQYQETKKGLAAEIFIQTKLNAKTVLSNKNVHSNLYYFPAEIRENGIINEDLNTYKNYKFNLLFDLGKQ